MKSMAISICVLAALIASSSGEEPKSAEWPALPHAVSSLGATTCEGYVYIYGGHVGKSHSYDKSTVLGTFHRFKIDGGKEWETLPSGQILQGMNLATHGGKVYLVGGTQPRNDVGSPADLVSVADCMCYDPAKKSWEKIPSLPAGRSSHEVAVAADKLVVFGGWEMRGKGEKSVWSDNVFVLDLARPDAKWVSLPQPFQRRSLTGTGVGSKVYAIGGLTAKGKSEKRVDILDVATGQWSQGPDLPGEDKVGFSPAACTLNGRVIVNTSEGPIYRLSAKGDSWEKVGEVENTRIVHRLTPAGKNAVVVLGGAGDEGNIGVVELVKIAD